MGVVDAPCASSTGRQLSVSASHSACSKVSNGSPTAEHRAQRSSSGPPESRNVKGAAHPPAFHPGATDRAPR
ncbi:hypothetical protein [Streptomyces sp. NPDC041003]|uniref:hypothetical protein n=1 Tax=Streptomyces sp. NPDC041003 TaxID=3155730 RepID=UPI0033F7FE33